MLTFMQFAKVQLCLPQGQIHRFGENMFGSRRKKVTKVTIEMAKQPLAIFQHTYGLPSGFWTDDFILGYFGTSFGVISSIVGGGRLSHTDKGFLLVDAFAALSNMNGRALAERYIELGQMSPKSKAFELGADNGSIVTLAALGKVSSIGQKSVSEAQEIANEQGHPENMLTILSIRLFVDPILERFDLLQKKKTEQNFDFLEYFQVNHPLDIPYEIDLKGTPTNDPKIQAELNRLVDLACSGASLVKLQSVLLAQSGDPSNHLELGYVFGCLDAYKTLLWGVEDFNRSFFHCGFRSYYGSMEAARTALINLGIAITDNNPEFMRAANVGKSDGVKMITEKTQPSGLRTIISKQN